MKLSTFSIVAWDQRAGEWGVAVQSKFLAAAAVVPWARAGVGAIATQAHANVGYGPRGLDLLARGLGAEEVVSQLTGDDPQRERRQLAVVDSSGGSAAFTGEGCMDWAGHVVGDGYSCQGNILAGSRVAEAMAIDLEASSGPLADRLVSALRRGQEAGGDRRGQQSAGLLVVRAEGGYGGHTDRYIDLRVDDHPEPVEELARLLDLFYLYFQRPDPGTLLSLEGNVAARVRQWLSRLGYPVGQSETWTDQDQEALDSWVGRENFEERMRKQGLIDPAVMDYLKARADQIDTGK